MLIDYVASDISVLALASAHVGKVCVLKQKLATVEDLTARDCKKHDIEVIDVDTDVLVEAGAKAGRLSFEDWLCFVVCRDRAWSCLSNDRALLGECRKAGISVRRGLGLMVELVRQNAMSKKRSARRRTHSREQSAPHQRTRASSVPSFAWGRKTLRDRTLRQDLLQLGRLCVIEPEGRGRVEPGAYEAFRHSQELTSASAAWDGYQTCRTRW